MLTDIFQFMLWSFWFIIWISAVMICFQCIVDLFRDHALSGWGNAGWFLVLDPPALGPTCGNGPALEHGDLFSEVL